VAISSSGCTFGVPQRINSQGFWEFLPTLINGRKLAQERSPIARERNKAHFFQDRPPHFIECYQTENCCIALIRSVELCRRPDVHVALDDGRAKSEDCRKGSGGMQRFSLNVERSLLNCIQRQTCYGGCA
jgi:hypothetical protein